MNTTLLSLLIGCACTTIAVSSVYLPQSIVADIATSFDVMASDISAAFGLSSLVYALSFFFFGPLTDRYSAKRIALGGSVLLTLLLALSGSAQTFNQYRWLMAGAGFAAAAIPSSMFSLMIRLAKPTSVATYLSYLVAATVVGIVAGRALGGMVTAAGDWQHTFRYLAILVGCASLCLLGLPVADHRPSASESLLQSYLKAAQMLADSGFRFYAAMGFGLFFGYLGLTTYLILRLKQAPFYFDAGQIGWINTSCLVAVLGAPLSGKLLTLTRMTPARLMTLSLLLVLMGIVILAVPASVAVVLSGVTLLFLGVFLCQPVIFSLATQSVVPVRRGAAGSLYMLTCLVAGSLSVVFQRLAWNRWGWQAIVVISLFAVGCTLVMSLRLTARRYQTKQRGCPGSIHPNG